MSGRRAKSAEQVTWEHMVQRCTNPKNHAYRLYGARGITIHPRWRVLKNFLADVGTRPPGTTLDRIDNARGYEPGNVRWATPREQRRNARTSKLQPRDVRIIRRLLARGFTQRDIAAVHGVSRGSILQIWRRTAWVDV